MTTITDNRAVEQASGLEDDRIVVGTVALHKIILRACNESDSPMFEKFKWAIALFNREKKRKRGD